MPLTIKKSKLTLKAPVEEAAVPEFTSAEAPGEAVPEKETKSGAGDMIFQIVSLVFAVLAIVLFSALLFMQMSESSFYNDAIPPAFVPGSISASAPAPVPIPTPAPKVAAPAAPAPATPAPAATSAPAATAPTTAPTDAPAAVPVAAPAAAPAAEAPAAAK